MGLKYTRMANRFYIVGGTGFEDEIFSNIEAFSGSLFKLFPDHFVPFMYRGKFDRFASLCAFFGIPIPPPPGKVKKRERACYYLRINEALQEFRNRHGLTSTELVAFLYDFAPRMMASQEDRDLPPPSKVWFTMGGIGGNADFEFLDQATPDSVSWWQGNSDTKRGDVILMWCVSPRSYLHSVWRAVDDGFVDPFFYFYSAIRIGPCINVPPIPFKEFMTDPRLGSNPFVKSHFQGAGGKPFPLEDYLRILEILAGKGFDTSSLPVPPRHAFVFGDSIQSERDVELQLIEPLLSRLGYTAADWLRQMPIRMGRGERNYPDYAVSPVTTRGEESAGFLIEAKLSIATRKQLEDAYLQGKSYGLRLQAHSFALAAQEGVLAVQGIRQFRVRSQPSLDLGGLGASRRVARSGRVDRKRKRPARRDRPAQEYSCNRRLSLAVS